MSNSFYSLIFRQKYIKRWGLMRNITEENLSSHSFEVAVIAHALALIGNKQFGKHYNPDRVCTVALFHDSEEVYTGDMPTPIKYFSPEMRENYKKVEEIAADSLISKLPKELQNDYIPIIKNEDHEIEVLVKAADKLCAYIKCIEEEKCGNIEFTKAKEATKKALDSYSCEELKWFMDNVLGSFELTLDEM